MTTDDFVERLRTLEGQLTLQLGARMVHEYDVDNIAFMRPVGEAIRVGEFKGSYEENVYGTRNPNLDNKTLTAICAHIHCDSEVEKVPPRCISTFIPKGHCCPVCGSLFEVQTYLKSLNELEQVFAHFSEEFARKNKILVHDVFHTSIERVDESDYELRYQDNATVIDEDLLISTSTLFLSTLGQYWHPSIVLGIFSFFIFSIFATFYFSVEARNQTRVLYRRGRVVLDGLRSNTTPSEVEMSEHLVEREGDEKMDLSSECESSNPISFANMAFSVEKEGTLVDFQKDDTTSEVENEPSKETDAEGMTNVDLL
uniref:Uncharacterized protein n=1 Tax=Pristionchus pacificus TaxID=54126 RepID=A0A2A6CAB9_PRIPA|eukprot:PDM75124.1 hypothetical protein PRIPAC_40505 [Pristionchus pacificus]